MINASAFPYLDVAVLVSGSSKLAKMAGPWQLTNTALVMGAITYDHRFGRSDLHSRYDASTLPHLGSNLL